MCQNTRLGSSSGSCLACGRSCSPPLAPGGGGGAGQHTTAHTTWQTQILEEHDVQEGSSDCNSTSPFPTINDHFRIVSSLWELNHWTLTVAMVSPQATHSHEISASSSLKRRKWTRSWSKLLLSLGVQFCNVPFGLYPSRIHYLNLCDSY